MITVMNCSARSHDGLIHLANRITESVVYVWCLGEDTWLSWVKCYDDEAPTCIKCLAIGPRGEWEPAPDIFGACRRWEMQNGTRWRVYAQETK